jgi:hypothetical protein
LGDIQSGNIQSGDIQSGDIQSGDIQSGDIQKSYIQSGYIQSGDIQSGDIMPLYPLFVLPQLIDFSALNVYFCSALAGHNQCLHARKRKRGFQTFLFIARQDQGDQVGRIFAPWAIVYLGQFL